MDMEHKLLDYAQHLGVYVGGVFAVFSAAFGMWWKDKKAVKKRIATLESLAEHMASKDDLIECRDDVDKQDADNLKAVLVEIQAVRRENRDSDETNSQQHQDILHKMTELHSK